MKLPMKKEDLMDGNEHHALHLAQEPTPPLTSSSVPPVGHSISYYVFLVFMVLFLWIWARKTMEQQVQTLKTMTRQEWMNFLEIFLARFLLEVCGAGGAVWGFSEAVGFRTDNTTWFWRPAALSVAAVFFSRWLLQIRDFVNDHQQDVSVNIMVQKEVSVVENGNKVADDSALLLKTHPHHHHRRASRRGSYGGTSSCELLLTEKGLDF